MINDVCKLMTNTSVLLGYIQMTESGLYGKWKKKGKEAQCVTVVVLDDCHFFCFPKWKRGRQ
jgi:hypothetical protein